MASSLPYPWSIYLELQGRGAALYRVGDEESGVSNGLSHILTAIECGEVPLDPEELAQNLMTVIATGGWTTRNQARLRLKFASSLGNENAPDPQLSMIALQRLRQVQGQLPEQDWQILRFVGEGFTYDEIAALSGLTIASLRTRVSRLRKQLLH